MTKPKRVKVCGHCGFISFVSYSGRCLMCETFDSYKPKDIKMNPNEEEKAVEEFSTRLYDPTVPVHEVRGLLADTMAEMQLEREFKSPEEVEAITAFVKKIDSALDVYMEPGD